MLIFDDIKLIYLANPKTGTTAFEQAFRRYANKELSDTLPKHVPFRRVRRVFPQLVKQYEVVTCVREPLDTLYSWYRYRQRALLKGDPNSTYGVSFKTFIEEWCEDDPAEFARINGSVRFVLSKNGLVHKKLGLFRYGGNPSIIDYVAEKRGQSVQFRREGASAIIDYFASTVSPDVWIKRQNVSPDPDPGELAEVRASELMHEKKMLQEYELYAKLTFVND